MTVELGGRLERHAPATRRHVVDVYQAPHLAGRGWSTAWGWLCSCGTSSASVWRTAGEARRAGDASAKPHRGPSEGAKPDELALWDALVAGVQPRDAGHRLGIPPKRVVYLCEKWARQRIYSYGVVADRGWRE